jgi:NAD(P)-dependent dehydrogenase (short-subunit alcohol dehydrogenase family)
MDLKLKGKVALVTGAGSQVGFGKAICLRLAGEGCFIIAADINLEGAGQTVEAVRALGCRGLAVKCDITKKAEVQEMVKQGLAEFSRIDILVNNAGGVLHGGSFLEQDEALWDKELALNLKGPMFCSQAVIPGMLQRKYGKIIIISSSSARIVHTGVSMYTIAKGATFIFTRGLAKQYAKDGIIVNSIAPGWSLETDFVKGGQPAKDRMKPMFMQETPLGRGTSTEDIANMVAYLASDVSGDVVGQVISVDGGSTFS